MSKISKFVIQENRKEPESAPAKVELRPYPPDFSGITKDDVDLFVNGSRVAWFTARDDNPRLVVDWHALSRLGIAEGRL
jgi:hypothetical protein